MALGQNLVRSKWIHLALPVSGSLLKAKMKSKVGLKLYSKLISARELSNPVREGDWMITPAVSCQSIVKVPLERSVQCTADMAGMAGHLNPFCPLITVHCVCQGFQ